MKWVKRVIILVLFFYWNYVLFKSLDLKYGKVFIISIKNSFVLFFYIEVIIIKGFDG